MTSRNKRIVGFLALALVASSASAVRADFQIFIIEDAGPVIQINDGGPLDADGIVNGSITVNTPLVNFALSTFEFSGLSATSNRLSGIPFSATETARLTQTGEARRIAGTPGTLTLTIIATDTDFLFPSGPGKILRLTASDTYSSTVAGDVRTFQSFLDLSNTDLGVSDPTPVGIASPLLTFPFSGTSSSAGSAAQTLIASAILPYALTNRTIITLGPVSSGSSSPPSDQFTGTTTVIVPEPSAWMSAGLGLAGLITFGRRRRA